MNGARLTGLGLAMLAAQEREAKADDFGYPIVDEPEAAKPATTEPEQPKVVEIFNVGNSYTIAPPSEPGKPKPIVKKINNKFARRILRKRGGESRVAREVRNGWAQRSDARRVTENSHEAARLLDAQREYQRMKREGIEPETRGGSSSGRFA